MFQAVFFSGACLWVVYTTATILPTKDFFGKNRSQDEMVIKVDSPHIQTVSERNVLPVPYVSETPEGIKTKPWGNACEEASVMMVDQYYRGKITVTIAEAKFFMQKLFDEQDVLYGSNDNSNTKKTKAFIDSLTSFQGVIKDSPTLDDIKEEIRSGRPVIAPNFGIALNNKNIPFNPMLSSFHMSVIIGFDDARRVFVVHDPGDDQTGAYHEYGYDLYMNAIHDYDEVRNKADGPKRVIFTESK